VDAVLIDARGYVHKHRAHVRPDAAALSGAAIAAGSTIAASELACATCTASAPGSPRGEIAIDLPRMINGHAAAGREDAATLSAAALAPTVAAAAYTRGRVATGSAATTKGVDRIGLIAIDARPVVDCDIAPARKDAATLSKASSAGGGPDSTNETSIASCAAMTAIAGQPPVMIHY
jgi:hypothetical protein